MFKVSMKVIFDVRHPESGHTLQGAGIVTRVDKQGNPQVAPFAHIGRGMIIENIRPAEEAA